MTNHIMNRIKITHKIQNMIKITSENMKYDYNHMYKYEIQLKSCVKIRKRFLFTDYVVNKFLYSVPHK